MINLKLNKSRLAKTQADGMLESIQKLDKTIVRNDKYLGQMNAVNVLSGLCIELYLKAFMLAGRDEGTIKGHNLEVLFNELPDFLKTPIRMYYQSNFDRNATLMQGAIIISENIPDDIPVVEAPKLDTFDNAIKTLSRIFVDSRYFFEELNDQDWIVYGYYYESIQTICLALETILEQYLNGAFKR